MRRRARNILLLLALCFCLCGCTEAGGSSSLTITFMDVGQGDSALVECDHHYMLVDGGNVAAGNKVYNLLEEKGVQRLDILAISHFHEDHIGGLSKALNYATTIKKTIANADYNNSAPFRKLEHQLYVNDTKISVPHEGDKFKLGSAEIEVLYASSSTENDSLVFMLTYGNTRFLFTGDIDKSAQTNIYRKYRKDYADIEKIDLMKMPHHGGDVSYDFMDTFLPDHVVISVGRNNQYGHPNKSTLTMLDSKTYHPHVYRTDEDGDIIVKSNGEQIKVETQR